MAIISVANVRTTVGIADTTVISDADITSMILEAQDSVDHFLNTAVEPKTVIEHLTSEDGSTRIMARHTPVLQVQAVDIDDTTVTPEYVKVIDGMILYLTEDAEETAWDSSDELTNRVKILYGRLENTTTQSTSNAAVTKGSAVDVTVASATGFSTDDYVRIEGMDGNVEVSKVTVTGSVLQFATLVYGHEASSVVTKVTYPQIMKRLVEVITALMIVARIVGQSYTDIVGYGIGEINVQKGEPYTQWRETMVQMDKERVRILQSLRPEPAVM